jgi:hypothetical protein
VKRHDMVASGPMLAQVVAAILAVILLVDVSLLWLTGKPVPELLGVLVAGVFGFYFGSAPGFRRGTGTGPLDDLPRGRSN